VSQTARISENEQGLADFLIKQRDWFALTQPTILSVSTVPMQL
jgi:hypothetical protein